MSFVTWIKARVIWPTLLVDVERLKAKTEAQDLRISALEARLDAVEKATSTEGFPEL